MAMIDADGRLIGRVKLYSEEVESAGVSEYPKYQVLKGENEVDIVEHRAMEPIFYMTDDPAVWEQLTIRGEQSDDA